MSTPDPNASARDREPAAPLTRETVLVRRPELGVRLASSGEVTITDEGHMVQAGEHSLVVLDAFRRPRSLDEVARELSVEGTRDFAALVSTIMHLARHRVLVPPGGGAIARAERLGWDSSSIHARMLNDTVRTQAFAKALEETVRPDDVVVDIGTGTGILAIAAARAGAKKVYAIEASSMGEVARDMFAQNGLSDRIELIRGWSTRVSLPERATVLVSETVGNEALGENIIEIYLDAHKRLLAPDARLIPAGIRVYGLPCTLPDAFRRDHLFCPENVAEWSSTYAVDFAMLARAGAKATFPLYLRAPEARDTKSLGSPALITEIDLARPDAIFERSVTSVITEEGRLDGVLLYFTLALSPGVDFSSVPYEVANRHSWRFPIWVKGTGRTVHPGEEVRIGYRYHSGVATVDFS